MEIINKSWIWQVRLSDNTLQHDRMTEHPGCPSKPWQHKCLSPPNLHITQFRVYHGLYRPLGCSLMTVLLSWCRSIAVNLTDDHKSKADWEKLRFWHHNKLIFLRKYYITFRMILYNVFRMNMDGFHMAKFGHQTRVASWPTVNTFLIFENH